ncbi:electron transport complex subunit E [Clostridia bacterium]|nr:electron transport complex subunit E [Clostridia bacterium]
MSIKKEFTKGIFKENPIFVLLLGMCPTLAVTTSVNNAIGMGLSVIAVLTASNIVVSLLRNIIPDSVRIPSYIVIIATFVTMIEMLVHAFFVELYSSLGIFLPLIVVNCIILGRAEAFANKNTVTDSIFDALGMGIGFTMALIILSTFREVLGAGSFMGHALFGEAFQPALVMILPPGAFLTLGCILGVIQFHKNKKAKEAK